MKTFLIMAASWMLLSCTTSQVQKPVGHSKLQVIPMTDMASNRYHEFSGMTWYQEHLLLLPQYPSQLQGVPHPALFAIPKSQLESSLGGANTPITPILFHFDDDGVHQSISGFEGFEAIAVRENDVTLVIEANSFGTMASYLVQGSIDAEEQRITLDAKTLRVLSMPLQLDNMAYESMMMIPEGILLFYEANGKNLQQQARALLIKNNGQETWLPMPATEYRLTDATTLDAQNRFWLLNYFYTGDAERLNPPGLPTPPKPVEQLLEWQMTPEGPKRTQTPPLVFTDGTSKAGRNWEGLVRFEDHGFLVITDKYPGTLLAYVPR